MQKPSEHDNVSSIRPNLGLVTITNNDQARLARSLESVKGVVAEIVIVDLGSTDGTKDVAAAFGGTVIDFKFDEDFSPARNAGLDAAAAKWILHLDPGEELVSGAEELSDLFSERNIDAYEAYVTSAAEKASAKLSLGSGVALRLFRNKTRLRYASPVNERIDIKDFERVGRSKLLINNFRLATEGRSEAESRVRQQLSLLLSAISKRPDIGYLHASLGQEYMALGDFASAMTAFQAALENSSPAHPYVPDLLGRVAICLFELGHVKQAFDLLHGAQQNHQQFTDLFFVEAQLLLSIGNADLARQLLERCLEMGDAAPGFSSMGGAGSWRAKQALDGLYANK